MCSQAGARGRALAGDWYPSAGGQSSGQGRRATGISKRRPLASADSWGRIQTKPPAGAGREAGRNLAAHQRACPEPANERAGPAVLRSFPCAGSTVSPSLGFRGPLPLVFPRSLHYAILMATRSAFLGPAPLAPPATGRKTRLFPLEMGARFLRPAEGSGGPCTAGLPLPRPSGLEKTREQRKKAPQPFPQAGTVFWHLEVQAAPGAQLFFSGQGAVSLREQKHKWTFFLSPSSVP